MTHRLEALVESSVQSLALPFPVATSRERLFFDVVGFERFSEKVVDCSAESLSLSLACSRSFSFCLAALTRALERRDLDSKTTAEGVDVDGSWSNSDWGSWVVLELVASC
jgi:hypothetical protein